MAATTPTLEQQAQMLRALVERCENHDGLVAGATMLVLRGPDVEALRFLAARLERMAPHESAIRRIVTGGKR